MNITSTAKTLNRFFNQVATSWLEDNVPTGATFPYITYSLASEAFGEEGVLQVRIWTQSRSIQEACALTDKLEGLITEGGTVLENGNGYLWLYKGSPFAQLEPTTEEDIKAMYIVLGYRNI